MRFHLQTDEMMILITIKNCRAREMLKELNKTDYNICIVDCENKICLRVSCKIIHNMKNILIFSHCIRKRFYIIHAKKLKRFHNNNWLQQLRLNSWIMTGTMNAFFYIALDIYRLFRSINIFS